MLEDIFETIIRGSNTVYLDIPEEEYFFSYDSLSNENAQEITEYYFKKKQKDGIPHVSNIKHDPFTHTVKISVDVDNHRDFKLEPYIFPDVLNIKREQ